jgi:hypothetical protein
MDINKLVDVLRATLQPDQREEAEKQLSEVRMATASYVTYIIYIAPFG